MSRLVGTGVRDELAWEPAVLSTRRYRRWGGEGHEADLAIVGFGFCGLAVLINLVRARSRARVTVVAEDQSGLGVAYGTRAPAHLLNVPTARMGAWADEEEHFLRWLGTPAGQKAAAVLGVEIPASDDYAPRALYARYLGGLREAALRHPTTVERARFVKMRADRLVPRPGGGWIVQGVGSEVHARACVLAVGNEPRRVFGSLRHRDLHDGWSLSPEDCLPANSIVLVGSGLTALDAVLQLRGYGYTGEILMLSRSGALPQAHPRPRERLAVSAEDLAGMKTLNDVLSYIESCCAAGHDCRTVIDGLRPHTSEVWQRLSDGEQREAVSRWASAWNRARHRCAPEVASKLAREFASGTLRLAAARRVAPMLDADKLSVRYEQVDGTSCHLDGVTVIDCTGQQLSCQGTRQPLLRGLLDDGLCTPHPTGLGLSAGPDLEVAEDVYALGAILTGQLWETIAVPELRQQAAHISEQLGAIRASRTESV